MNPQVDENEDNTDVRTRLPALSEAEETGDYNNVGYGRRKVNTTLRRKRSQSLVDLQQMSLNCKSISFFFNALIN